MTGRVAFPAGSKPFMLRVAPDGRTVWVQTAGSNENVILDAESLATLASTPVGVDPETVAFQPGGPYALVAHLTATFLVVLDRTGREVCRIELGATQGPLSFTPDGRRAFVSLNSAGEVAVIDMATLAEVGRIPVGERPMGLILLDRFSG